MQAMRIRQATSVGEVGTGSQQNVVGGMSSDQAPKPSNHRKTSLSVNSLPLILPTPIYLHLPTYPAEQTAQPLYKPASGTHVTTAYPVHASGSPPILPIHFHFSNLYLSLLLKQISSDATFFLIIVTVLWE